MKNRSKVIHIALFVVLMASGVACAFGIDEQTGDKGYFWYEVNRNSTKEEEKKPPIQATKEPRQKQIREKKDFEIDWKAVWNMHPDQFQNLLNKTEKRAVQYPNKKQYMRDYIKLKFVAQKRASDFQIAYGRARKEMPLLDYSVRRAPNSLASRLEVDQRRQNRQKVVPKMRENMGLFFFFSTGCRYCEEQKEILSHFVEKWEWRQLKSINIDQHPELRKKYQVEIVPDLWVVGKVEGEIREARLGAGLLNLGEIERGLTQLYFRWFEGKHYERPNMTKELKSPKDYILQKSESRRDQ